MLKARRSVISSLSIQKIKLNTKIASNSVSMHNYGRFLYGDVIPSSRILGYTPSRICLTAEYLYRVPWTAGRVTKCFAISEKLGNPRSAGINSFFASARTLLISFAC